MAMANEGAALVVEEKNLERDFEEVFNQLLVPERRKEMSKSLKKLAKPNATAQIVDLIEGLL